MATVDEQAFSASTNGRQIKVAATSSPGTLILAATAGNGTAEDHDRVYLYLHNNSAADVLATVEFGGTAVDDQESVTIPSRAGRQLIVPGLPLQNALEVKVFAASPDVIMASGYIHRIDK